MEIENHGKPFRPSQEDLNFLKAGPAIPEEVLAKHKYTIDRMMRGDIFFDAREKSLYREPEVMNVSISCCYTCRALSIWVSDKLLYPPTRTGIEPNPDLPPDVTIDYNEARMILDHSPRGAAALLRLCIQKLCRFVGEGGDNINDDIASLVTKGLDRRIQQALDIVRVVGNDAVHPGQIDLRDDRETALNLFGLVNLIADRLISEPKHIDAMYLSLPESKRLAIEKRDKKA